jgi:protein-tyrosine phosphatase
LIDIHSHILPGIDDGAQSIEESLEMLRMAAASGTTDIVATPHANVRFTFDADAAERLLEQLARLTPGLIQLHRGCDFHLNFDNLTDALNQPRKFTINNGRYLMVELPELFAPSAMETALLRLLEIGILPVITHPERNRFLVSRPKLLEALVRRGCLAQITGQSLLGRFGSSAQRSAESMLSAGVAHFIASDAHDCTDRTPDLSAAYQVVKSRWGADKAKALFIDNPAATLRDEPLATPAAPSPRKSPLFAFWK